MEKSDFITKVFLGMYGINELFRYSMFYKENLKINNLLYSQSKKFLNDDVYKYINASDLVRNNLEIAKYVLNKDSRLIHYINESLKSKLI